MRVPRTEPGTRFKRETSDSTHKNCKCAFTSKFRYSTTTECGCVVEQKLHPGGFVNWASGRSRYCLHWSASFDVVCVCPVQYYERSLNRGVCDGFCVLTCHGFYVDDLIFPSPLRSFPVLGNAFWTALTSVRGHGFVFLDRGLRSIFSHPWTVCVVDYLSLQEHGLENVVQGPCRRPSLSPRSSHCHSHSATDPRCLREPTLHPQSRACHLTTIRGQHDGFSRVSSPDLDDSSNQEDQMFHP